MKQIRLVKGKDLEYQPLELEAFIQNEVKKNTIEKKREGVSKKMLRQLADELGLSYDEKQLGFSKKLLNHYLKQEKR